MQDRTSARSAKPLATHGGPYIRVIRDLVEPAASPAKSAMPRKRKLRGDTHRLYFGHLAGCFDPSKHQAGRSQGRPEIHRTASASGVSSSSRPPIALTW